VAAIRCPACGSNRLDPDPHRVMSATQTNSNCHHKAMDLATERP
jgi:hypothetical protein